MAGSKRIALKVPEQLLQDLDGLAAVAMTNRSAVILEAVRLYVSERKRRDMREQLRRGYQEMARINLDLAEEGLAAEWDLVRQQPRRADEP